MKIKIIVDTNGAVARVIAFYVDDVLTPAMGMLRGNLGHCEVSLAIDSRVAHDEAAIAPLRPIFTQATVDFYHDNPLVESSFTVDSLTLHRVEGYLTMFVSEFELTL